MFGAGPQDDVRVSLSGCNGDKANRQDDKYYTLETVAVGAVNLEARRLSWDFESLASLPEVLPQHSPLGNKARALANKIMNTFDGTLESVRDCRQMAEDVMGKGWQEDANKQTGQEDGTLWALGYCHIDTAWYVISSFVQETDGRLWPWSATQQKVARTWSSQIEISDRYPEFRFFASAAQHYKWLEEFYPAVFDKVKQKIKEKKFGKFGCDDDS
jgi:alpha-mannosidase